MLQLKSTRDKGNLGLYLCTSLCGDIIQKSHDGSRHTTITKQSLQLGTTSFILMMSNPIAISHKNYNGISKAMSRRTKNWLSKKLQINKKLRDFPNKWYITSIKYINYNQTYDELITFLTKIDIVRWILRSTWYEVQKISNKEWNYKLYSQANYHLAKR